MTTKSTALNMLSCLDTADMATSCRYELDIPRGRAAALGHSAVEASSLGYYLNSAGDKVDWSIQVRQACSAKLSIAPDAPLPTSERVPQSETRVQVCNETTLQASHRLVQAGLRPLALNFANGVHPGGGFLNGARAQEEVLCRSSALYCTLVDDPMYEYHRGRPRPDSSDWVIYSPDVPVFRSDDGAELDHPWLLSFLTSAAPYAPSIGQPESGDLLCKRIHRVLAVASAYGHESLVLGAWGCGAFGNDPHRTAIDFRKTLELDFRGHFSDVVFAITDWSPERRFLGPFRDVFSPAYQMGAKLEQLRFFATSISTDDAYYLHFSDTPSHPQYYIIIQGARASSARVSVRLPGRNATTIGGIEHVALTRNSVSFHFSRELVSAVGGFACILADFDVDDDKYRAICRQLYEILRYSPETQHTRPTGG